MSEKLGVRLAQQFDIMPDKHPTRFDQWGCGCSRAQINGKTEVAVCDEHSVVICLDCGWKGSDIQLLAQACPVCDGRCADV